MPDRLNRNRVVLSALLCITMILGLSRIEVTSAQVRVTATPVRAVIPQATVLPTDIALSTATPTRTPTPEGPVVLRAINSDVPINVRAEPDPNSQLLGQLDPQQTYPVRGFFFSWYQFDFESSPTGRGWVFNSLVEIIGDEALLPEVNPFVEPTVDAAVVAATQTIDAAVNNPDAALTLTADARNIAVPTRIADTGSAEEGDGRLPTFTPPPDFARRPTQTGGAEAIPSPTPDLLTGAISTVSNTDIPPIVPIAVLGSLGILGLLISALNRS